MWRQLAAPLGVLVVMVVLVGAAWQLGRPGGEHIHVYNVRVPVGTTLTLSTSAIGYPFTVRCPKRGASTAGSGLTQVIREPLPGGKVSYFGGAPAGTSITIKVRPSGQARISCS
jgi:hypothetical protein